MRLNFIHYRVRYITHRGNIRTTIIKSTDVTTLRREWNRRRGTILTVYDKTNNRQAFESGINVARTLGYA